MPTEHADRREEDAGIEEFLADPGDGAGDLAGKARNGPSADKPGHDAAGNPAPAPGRALAGRQHQPDHQGSL